MSHPSLCLANVTSLPQFSQCNIPPAPPKQVPRRSGYNRLLPPYNYSQLHVSSHRRIGFNCSLTPYKSYSQLCVASPRRIGDHSAVVVVDACRGTNPSIKSIQSAVAVSHQNQSAVAVVDACRGTHGQGKEAGFGEGGTPRSGGKVGSSRAQGQGKGRLEPCAGVPTGGRKEDGREGSDRRRVTEGQRRKESDGRK